MIVLLFFRLFSVPSTPLDMVIDYFYHDGEFAEPPAVTSLQNTEPLPTSVNFGPDMYQVSDQRGYESVVHDLARQFLSADDEGAITDPRLKLNKASRILYSLQNLIYLSAALQLLRNFHVKNAKSFFSCRRW